MPFSFIVQTLSKVSRELCFIVINYHRKAITLGFPSFKHKPNNLCKVLEISVSNATGFS